MAKQIIILVSVVFFSIAVFTVQTLPQTRSSNRILKPPAPDAERLRNMTAEERKREFAKGREQRRLDREQRSKEFQKRIAEIKKEFLYQKYALRATEEQWKVIKAKLEKVRRLRGGVSSSSTAGLFLTSTSSSGANTGGSRGRSAPRWQWDKSWKGKAPGELTEGQKIADEIMDLLEKRNTKAEEFRRKMDALRKSRSREQVEKRKKKEELSKARQELREVLTTRQEAALVLMHWL